MARRYGRLNRYRSRIRRCALSGLRGYEHEMIHKWGHWYLPRWVDKEAHAKDGRIIHVGEAGAGPVIQDPWTHGQSSPSSTPSATVSATASATVSATPSGTQSPSATPSATVSATASGTPSAGSDTFYIAAGTDDGYYRADTAEFNTNASYLYFGPGSGGAAYNMFIRFTGVSIPQGATISTAYVTMRAAYPISATHVIAVYLENADNPSAPADWADMDGRPKTSGVAWTPIGSWTYNSYYDTPELSSILQTVVNRAGFAGDAVTVYIYENGSSSVNTVRAVYSYDGTGVEPVLHVTWT